MNRVISLLLALCLALTLAVPALGEAADTPVPLPAVGDVVCGFEAKEIRPFPAIDAQVVLFEHQRTGAQLMYIANDDNNRVFDLSFYTDAIDKTGLPHVFEHSVLDGSEKYPSRTLWFNMLYQTYNTYMNAFTQSRDTSYPVASLSEAQLLIFADYYTQACLHPLVVEDESIFREEAWRYRMEDADSPLTIEGTVYSEMLGAYDLDSAASINALNAAFPGSTIGNEYGGDPDYIPNMTFEALRNYHSLYYHPSNSIAFIYGQFDDYTAFLKLLDEAYAPYERRTFTRDDAGYTPIEAPVTAEVPFPVEADSPAENASTIFYTIVCPGLSGEEELILNTFTDLMGDNASAMQQSLQRALPSGSFGAYIQSDSPDSAIVFTAQNVNPSDAELFKTTVDAALAQVAENGFPQDQVDGVMAQLEISTLLMREDADVGVNSIIPGLAYYGACDGNPWAYLEYIEGMGRMDDWNREGRYAEAVGKWLVDSQTTALVTTYPQPGMKEEKDAALAEKLAGVKAEMSDEEIAAIVAASNATDEAEDNAETIAAMQAVTVQSLPEEYKQYDFTDTTGDDGIRRIDVTAQVDGVGQAAVFLDAAGVPQEELHWMKLMTDLVGQMDTHAHTKEEIATLMGRYLNGGRVYVSVPGHGDDYHPYVRLSWIALDDDLAMGYDLMRELLFDMKLEDTGMLLEAVQGIRAALRTSINQSPYSVELYRMLGMNNSSMRYYAYVNYIDYYNFLTGVEAQLTSDPESVTQSLTTVTERFDNRSGAVSMFAGNEASIALNRPLADAFLMSLGEAEVTPAAYDLPAPARSEALIIDSGVQFNGELADYATLGMDGYDASLDAVTSLVNDAFLYPMLRDQYGAYSVFHAAMEYEGVYIISYRDPNISQTFDVYAQLPELVATQEVDQATLDGYILSAYAGYAKSEGELSGAIQTGLNALQGDPQDKALTYMRQLKAVTPESVKRCVEMYARLNSQGVKFTAGPASATNAQADRYEVILNPFGAKDKSQVVFEDVGEDNPAYEAVRAAYENGLMAPAAEQRFGVDDPATEGDVVAAIYVMAGGSEPDPEAAIELFETYGITGITPDAAVTGERADEMFNWLAGGAWQGEGGEEPLTRAGLAQRLSDFLAMLETLSQAS